MLRSRAQWMEQGEKSTGYFLGLENKNYTSKVIPKLVLNDGTEITDVQEILHEQTIFYEDLYHNKDAPDLDNAQEELFTSLTAPRLSEHTSATLEGIITYTEITQCLKQMKNNKSPGLDGFTIEFFKFFWSDVGHFVLRSINEAYDTGELSISLRRGVITCIPKQDKCRFV